MWKVSVVSEGCECSEGCELSYNPTTIQPYDPTYRLVLVRQGGAWYTHLMRTDRRRRDNMRANGPVVVYRLNDVDSGEVKEYRRMVQVSNGYLCGVCRTRRREQVMPKIDTGRNIKVRGVVVSWLGDLADVDQAAAFAIENIGVDVRFDYGEDFTATVPMSLSVARKVANGLRKAAAGRGFYLTPSHNADEETVKAEPSVWAIVTRELTAEEIAKRDAVEADEADEADEDK